MRTQFALLMIVAALVAAPSRLDADTLKFAWWEFSSLTTAQSTGDAMVANVANRMQVIANAGVDVMAGVGLSAKVDYGSDDSNGYAFTNNSSQVNGSADGISRVFAASTTGVSMGDVSGAKGSPTGNATALWSFVGKGDNRFAVVSAYVGAGRGANFMGNVKSKVLDVIAAADADAVMIVGIKDADTTNGNLTTSGFATLGLYLVRDGSSDGQWILCSDQTMAAAAASTVAELSGATTYGTAGYTAEFSIGGENTEEGFQVIFSRGEAAPEGLRVPRARRRAVALVSAAPAASVEVTPEFVCNPNATRWNKQGAKAGYFAREVQDLHVYNGKIYTAGGDWGAFSNQGPVPVFAIDPATGTFTNEFDAGTEMIVDYKTFSDGRLWVGAIDPKNGDPNIGHFFRRELDGTWTALSTCSAGHGKTWRYSEHTWDIAEFGGMFFTAGYGICASSNWGDTSMTDATPDLMLSNRVYATDVVINGTRHFNVGQARKFAAFMSFEDDLFCFSMDFGFKCDMQIFDWEEWRWDASAGKFVSSLVPWSDIAPGLTEEEMAISFFHNSSAETNYDIKPSRCRRFGSRVLYLIEGIKTNGSSHCCPWAAYSAVNQNHHVKATKIDLGGARPFDIHVSGNAAYIVATKGAEMGTIVTNSVWKTEDGVTFTELFHFATNRQATALCKYGDDFYVGMGYSTNVCYVWKNLPKDPELSGDIYRIHFDDGNHGGGQGGDDPQPQDPSDVAWFSYEAATGATSGGTWDGAASSFALSEPLTIDHVGTITMQVRVKSAAEFPVAEPNGITSLAFRRDGDTPVPWEWTGRGWQRLYGLSVAEGQSVSLVATVGNGKVSYSIDGVVLTNSAGRSVFSTTGIGFSSLDFKSSSVGDFSGTLRKERMKRFCVVLR